MISSVVKKAVSKFSNAMGYEIIPQWKFDRNAQACFLAQLFALLKIDCVLDVGANAGQYRDFLRKHVGYKGNIVSFEPMPESVKLLKERARHDAKWLIEGYALGAVAARKSFNIMHSNEFSSFLEPNHTRIHRFNNLNRIQSTVEVDVRTLESVLPEIEGRFKPYSLYLKMDTQGYDLEVVKGAGESIRKFNALQTEASVKPIYQGMPDFVEVIRGLQALGFEVSGIFPNNPEHFPALVEFDCHMISKERIPPSAL